MNQPNLDLAKADYARGDLQGAEIRFRRALETAPATAEAHYGLGLIALDRNDPTGAIQALKQALAADSSHVGALTALGVAFVQAGYAAKATTVLAEAVNQAPHQLEPRIHLARAFAAADSPEDALNILNRTAEDFPRSAEVWAIKGRVERSLGRDKDSYNSLRAAIDLDPGNPNTRNDLGVACRAVSNFAEAVQHYRSAIALDPGLAVAHANLGNVLDVMGEPDTAEASLRDAISLDPDIPDGTYNLACLLTKLEQPDEALPFFETLAEKHPDRWDIQTNLGVTYLALGNLDVAEIALRKSIALKPGNPEAHYNLAWLLLLTNRHQEGWAELEWRWHLPDFGAHLPDYTAPAWDGSVQPEATLLLHAEQGLGDTLQFVRFAAQAKSRVKHVILRCQPALMSLLNSIDGIDDVVPLGDPAPTTDVFVPLLSLPHVLDFSGTNTPGAKGYLKAPTLKKNSLKISDRGKRRIGLVWAGSPDNKIERRRKMATDLFLPLFDSADADFVSLQVGPAASDIANFPEHRFSFSCDQVVEDFADTAAVMSQLDLVIGIDTSVIHLAGALGVPTWVLLPFMPDYRWGLGRDTTPWYDSLRLFRQPGRGDWTAVIRDVCNALSSW